MKTIFGQIAEACLYVHFERRYIHRDLKLSNIVIEKRFPYLQIKLCDFGFARTLDTRMVSCIGTPICVYPKILENEEYDDRSDLFSIGCMLYFILHGKYPGDDCYSKTQLIQKYKENKVVFSSELSENDEFKDIIVFIKELLSLKEDKMSWEEFRDHSFVKECLDYLKHLREQTEE